MEWETKGAERMKIFINDIKDNVKRNNLLFFHIRVLK